MKKGKEIKWGFERDLSTLACHAAIELDSFLIDTDRGLNSVKEFSDKISKRAVPIGDSFYDFLLLDTQTMITLTDTLKNIYSGIVLESNSDYRNQAVLITERLNKIRLEYEERKTFDIGEFRKLRDFCLEFSKFSGAYEGLRLRHSCW